MKKKKYIPQKSRGYVQPLPKREVKMPKREVITQDRLLIQYYKEIFIMYVDLAIDAAEKVLDSDIDIMERFHLQTTQNDLYKINGLVKSGLRKQTAEKHENRVDFITEIVSLCTLVEPKHFAMMQKTVVNRIEELRGLKKS